LEVVTMTTTTNPERWAIWPAPRTQPVPDAVLADRWCGAMWPAGNASELALRLYGIVDEMAEAVTRVDMVESGEAVREVLDMDGLEQVVRLWILERVGPVAE
jgi:hypothetical protein